jgi:hypothetical protein
MPLTIRKGFLVEPNPTVIYPVSKCRNSAPTFETKELPGMNWIRVFPQNAADVLYLQLLVQHVDKFAPSTGHGVIVKRDALGLG